MKTVYKTIKIFLAAMCICLIFDSCSSRYTSSGRYRPRKSKKCKCPAYGYKIENKTQNTFVLSQPKES